MFFLLLQFLTKHYQCKHCSCTEYATCYDHCSCLLPSAFLPYSVQMKKLKIPIPRGINVAIAIPIALSSLPKLVCFSFCDHKITYRSLQKPCRYSHFKKIFFQDKRHRNPLSCNTAGRRRDDAGSYDGTPSCRSQPGMAHHLRQAKKKERSGIATLLLGCFHPFARNHFSE